jgi:hypothetical protein
MYPIQSFQNENERFRSELSTSGLCPDVAFDFRCERALQSPSYEGAIEEFCREKGHGYIRPKNNATELIFAHVSE